MKNFYLKHYVTGSIIIILMLTTGLANAQNTITVSGTGDVDGTYTYIGTSNGKPYYTKGTYRIEYRSDSWDFPTNVWMIWNTADMDWAYYYNTNTSSATPVMSGWYLDWGCCGTPTISNQVAFTNGASYTAPTPTRGTNNNPVGRFSLDPGATGSNVTAATVQFSGTASGITAVKLWSSADASFSSGSDVMLSSKTYASSVTFNSISSAMALTGTYYFITADLASNATGNVTSTIPNAAAFTISSGSVITSISNASLASGSVPLPVQLLSFTAMSKQDAVTLNWSTVKEEDFAGFEPERSVDGSNWTRLAFIAGNANSITTNTYYAYTDNNPVSGHTYYRLKMVDADGGFTYSKQLTVVKNSQNASLQNYPNPFNRTTSLTFQLPVNSFATLKVFNNMGVEVNTLINKQLEAGNYTVPFDGAALPAGLYFYTLRYGKEKISGTMLLNK